MKILIVSDAWEPQVNGVVRTLGHLRRELTAMGHDVEMITPNLFRSIPCPTYPEIRLALASTGMIGRRIDAFAPDAVHVATEGPLGMGARRHYLRRGTPFTTAYHTRFPEYIQARFSIPTGPIYHWLRRFHGKGRRMLAPTVSIVDDLTQRGFGNVVLWSRGVDTDVFKPGARDFLPGPRPILLYVGRVAVEKNIEAFLKLETPGTKYVVGEGPQKAELQRRYPNARYFGIQSQAELSRFYAAADVFVFPSRTDTFGLVLLEAMAAGLPVAAYPVAGPLDVIGTSGAGYMDVDLGRAVDGALAIQAERCRSHALEFSWAACAQQFLGHLNPLH